MEKTGYIEIIVSGAKGKLKLTPDTFDIKELTGIIEQAEKLLFPGFFSVFNIKHAEKAGE